MMGNFQSVFFEPLVSPHATAAHAKLFFPFFSFYYHILLFPPHIRYPIAHIVCAAITFGMSMRDPTEALPADSVMLSSAWAIIKLWRLRIIPRRMFC